MEPATERSWPWLPATKQPLTFTCAACASQFRIWPNPRMRRLYNRIKELQSDAAESFTPLTEDTIAKTLALEGLTVRRSAITFFTREPLCMSSRDKKRE
jgi:hypothetical protein